MGAGARRPRSDPRSDRGDAATQPALAIPGAVHHPRCGAEQRHHPGGKSNTAGHRGRDPRSPGLRSARRIRHQAGRRHHPGVRVRRTQLPGLMAGAVGDTSRVARDPRSLATVHRQPRWFAAGDDVQRGRLLAYPGARRLMAAAQTASDAIPGLPSSVPELLARRRAQPDGEFLVTDGERLSFAEADAQSRTLADALLASGVGKGTRVGILFPNCAQWLIAWLAAARIGALTVPLSTFAPGAELARLLRHTDVQMVLMGQSIAGRDLVERMQDALPGLTDGQAVIAATEAPYLRRIHVWPDCERSWAAPWPSAEPGASLASLAEDEVVPADD